MNRKFKDGDIVALKWWTYWLPLGLLYCNSAEIRPKTNIMLEVSGYENTYLGNWYRTSEIYGYIPESWLELIFEK